MWNDRILRLYGEHEHWREFSLSLWTWMLSLQNNSWVVQRTRYSFCKFCFPLVSPSGFKSLIPTQGRRGWEAVSVSAPSISTNPGEEGRGAVSASNWGEEWCKTASVSKPVGRGGRQHQHPIHKRRGGRQHRDQPRRGEVGGFTSFRGGEGIELANNSPFYSCVLGDLAFEWKRR